MERFGNGDGRSALVDASHINGYDPSAPYRATMMPLAPGTNQPTVNDPRLNNEQRSDLARRIPQFYYPRYEGRENWYDGRWRGEDPYLLSAGGAEGFVGYPQSEAYAPAPVYPYPRPYVVPLRSSPEDDRTFAPPASKSDLLASHEKDADLSRLEVYHFTPKEKVKSVNGAQPIIQYHVYPSAPVSVGGAGEPQAPYVYQWYGDGQHSAQPIPSFKQTKARSSQTEEPTTRNRAVSPMRSSNRSALFDDDGFPYVQEKALLTDGHSRATSNELYQNKKKKNKSTALPDCRCLDCQRERATLLNYYEE